MLKKLVITVLILCATTVFAQKKPLETAIFDQPALITVVGQSADIQMVKVLFDRNKITYNLNPLAKPENLKDQKTLVLVIGGSSKGLGAAGIDANQEAKRAQELIDAAKKANIKILAMHVGGENRRGDLTDRYIAQCTADAEYAIVVADGDKDQIFEKAMKGKYLDHAKNIGSVAPFIKKAFK